MNKNVLPDWGFRLLLFCIVYVLGIAVAWESLNYYWFNDDLFLVRTYSNEEIIASFSGTFAAPGSTTPGYRPLNVIFYHLESMVFGENILLLRLFNIALLATHVVILVQLAGVLGMTRWQQIIAGVLLICMKNTWFILVWPTDAMRPLLALLGLLSAYFLIRSLTTHSPAFYMVISALCFAIALFIREESLPYLVIIPAIALFYLWQGEPFSLSLLGLWQNQHTRRVMIGGIALLAVSVVFWLIRVWAVPDAINVVNLEGWVFHLFLVLLPRMPFVSVIFAGVSLVVFWGLLIWMMRRLPRPVLIRALFWLGCTVVGCALGAASPRANNLLLPMGFFALFLAIVLGESARHSHMRVICTVILVWFIIGSVLASKTAQVSIAPTSTIVIEDGMEMIWGQWAYLPTPQVRRDVIAARLEAFGLREDNFRPAFEQLFQETMAANRHAPTPEGLPFVPLTHWLHGW